MAATRPWHGVRLKIFEVGRDPDAPAHRVAVPAGWSEEAARGFVGLCCGDHPAGWTARRLPEEAACWIGRVIRRAAALGSTRDPVEWAETLHCLLILRQGCPDRSIWCDEEGEARFVLNAAAFADPETGLDRLCLEAAVDAAVAVLTTLSPRGLSAADRPCLRIADIDGALARLGLDYDSREGRDAAGALLALCRTTIAGAPVRLVVDAAGPAEALLGAETAGFAPAYSPLTADGKLTEASRARLAAQGLSAERALARTLDGETPLHVADAAAHAAMHDALAPLLDACPPRPVPQPRLVAVNPPTQRRTLPARSKGFTQKVSIGGHRLYLRTSEYADGTLGELSITLQGRDGTLSRGMADALSTAISTGLQHGVPLDRFVEAFAHTRFGASGTVEGDPSIAWASSPLDYAVRALAEAYLGRHLPDPAPTGEDEPAWLPLGLDDGAPPASGGNRQRALRLVSPA